MQNPSFFQRKKPIRSKQRNAKQSLDKVSIRQLYRDSNIRNSTPRITKFWDNGSVCSQRNSVTKNTKNRQKIKNGLITGTATSTTLKYQRKLNSRGNSHRYNKSAQNIGSSAAFVSCQVTPSYQRVSPGHANRDYEKRDSAKTNQMRVRDEYKFIYQIGFGGFGKVWKVQKRKDKYNGELAMKQIDKQKYFFNQSRVIVKKSVDSVMNELKILSVLDHPFLINMNRAFQDPKNLYLVMDYLRGADLRYHICYKVKFTQIEARFIIANIIVGLEYIHSSNIIHRDLKPENIVFQENGFARITDFGIAKIKVPNKPFNVNQTSGTPGYMAPQILFKEDYTFTSDFFALGVIAYELMLNRRPYEGTNRKEIREGISQYQAQVKKSEIPKNWSVEAADFINQLLQRNPKYRLGSAGIQDLKNHKWMESIKWSKLERKKIDPPFIPNVVCETRQYLEEIQLYNELNEDKEKHDTQISQQDQAKFERYNFDKAIKNINSGAGYSSGLKKMMRVNNYCERDCSQEVNQKENLRPKVIAQSIGSLNGGKKKKPMLFKKSRKCSQERIVY